MKNTIYCVMPSAQCAGVHSSLRPAASRPISGTGKINRSTYARARSLEARQASKPAARQHLHVLALTKRARYKTMLIPLQVVPKRYSAI